MTVISRHHTADLAIELAGSAEFRTVEEIRRALRRAGCVAIDAVLADPAFKALLRTKISDAIVRKRLGLTKHDIGELALLAVSVPM